ncbi:DUF389 domain-containing protein [Agrilactobacillus fermenti]|uniref:DUF389 domain-containing protein n=1 Tax=Agrilactobacillus fermenti TaxID=2586909 RepID=UPI001E3A1F55|nr:DUF389 domain-containing protein [Agrilactobacillus fermenti]MCD2256730.1 DUF389 domain-containing protein [Agrilactobacillus fermenti]
MNRRGDNMGEAMERVFQKSENIDQGIRKGLIFNWINFVILVCSIVIACVGLNLNSTPAIIGAMLISPLMDPILGMGYGIGSQDLRLTAKAVKLFVLEVVTALGASMLYFWISPLNDAGQQIISRSNPTVWDIMIAIFGGLAGIIAKAKKDSNNIIVGVAIATALMPPLCTVSFGLVYQDWKIAIGAGYLFLLNVFFIMFVTILATALFSLSHRDQKAMSLKKRLILLAIAMIISVPSIYSGASLVQKSLNEQHLNSFINVELSDYVVTDQTIDSANQQIELTVIGPYLNSKKIDQLEHELKKFQLGEQKLKLTQFQSDKFVTAQQMKQYVKDNQSKLSDQYGTVVQRGVDSASKLQELLDSKYPDMIDSVSRDQQNLVVTVKPQTSTEVKRQIKTYTETIISKKMTAQVATKP